jgi:hypothetical protein
MLLTCTEEVARLDAGRDAGCAEILRGFTQFLQESDEICYGRVVQYLSNRDSSDAV